MTKILSRIKKAINKIPFTIRLSLIPAQAHQQMAGARKRKRIITKAFLWLLPLIISLIFLPLIGPVFGQLTDRQTRLSQYLINNDIPTGTEKGESGFSQVYYEFDGEKFFVTTDAHPHGTVDIKGEYMTWISEIDGNWQVFLYHIPSDTTLQLTRSGNNSNPQVDNGKVVWEGWRNGSLQVYLFDGKTIGPITNSPLALHPQIEGEYIVYSEKNSIGLWSNYLYSIAENKKEELAVGEGEFVQFDDGNIYYGASSSNKKRHPLKAGDIFMLNLTGNSTSLDAEIAHVEAELARLRQEAALIPQVEEVQSASDSVVIIDNSIPSATSSGNIKEATGSATPN